MGLVDSLRLVDGITDVQSLTEAYGLEVDTITEKLKPFVLFDELPANGEEEIALEAKVKSWPFYKGGLYQGDTYMMILRIDETRLYNKRIVSVVEGAKKHILIGKSDRAQLTHEWFALAENCQCQQP